MHSPIRPGAPKRPLRAVVAACALALLASMAVVFVAPSPALTAPAPAGVTSAAVGPQARPKPRPQAKKKAAKKVTKKTRKKTRGRSTTRPKAPRSPRAKGPKRPRGPVVQTDGRPNIIVVMLDDMRADELAYAPNLRAYLTERGMAFENSFAPFPLCCPSRTSFLLGRYPHNHGIISGDLPYGFGSVDDSRTIAGALQAGGYNTALVGKYLNGYGVMPSKVTGRSSQNYVPAGWTDWMVSLDTNTREQSGKRGGTYNYMNFCQNVNGTVIRDRRNAPRRVKKRLRKRGIPIKVRGKYSSTVIADQSVQLIKKYHQRPQPFFLYLSPVAPHVGGPREADDPPVYIKSDGFPQYFGTPFVPPKYRGTFDSWITHAPGVPVSRPAEEDVSDKPDYIRQMIPNTPYEDAALLEVERQRAESIYAWDWEFSRIVAALQRTGEYDDTIFMFTSDNGYYLGEHRMPIGKINPHEPSIRVPLVVAGPGIARGVSYDPAMTADLTSTILDYAGVAPMPAQDGRSLRPQLSGREVGWDRAVIIEGFVTGRASHPDLPAGLSHSGIRTARWKYVRYGQGEEEMYDLAEDPNEMESLHADPAYAEIKSLLLREWRRLKQCDGPGCSAPLAPELRADPAAVRDLTVRAVLAKDAFYNQ